MTFDIGCTMDGRHLSTNYSYSSTSGQTLAFVYDFGDGTTRVDDLAAPAGRSWGLHPYTRPGRYVVTVTVVAHGAAATDTCTVTVPAR